MITILAGALLLGLFLGLQPCNRSTIAFAFLAGSLGTVCVLDAGYSFGLVVICAGCTFIGIVSCELAKKLFVNKSKSKLP